MNEDAGILMEPILTPKEQEEGFVATPPVVPPPAGTPPEPPATPPPPGTPEVPPIIGDVPHKDDPSRFEYWQSKFSKEQEERKKIEDKLNELSGRIPKPETPKPEVLTIPQYPQRPTYYDPGDAINDPQSDSFKFEQAREQYFRDMAIYNQKVLENTLKPIHETIEQQRQTTEFQKKKAYTVGQFQGVGLAPGEAAEAFDFFTSEESLKPENLVLAYKAIKSAKVSPIPPSLQTPPSPPPPGLKNSGNEVTKTIDEEFSDNMIKNWGKKP
jgi:hypothetical protein